MADPKSSVSGELNTRAVGRGATNYNAGRRSDEAKMRVPFRPVVVTVANHFVMASGSGQVQAVAQ
jgi:hypothetical protein